MKKRILSAACGLAILFLVLFFYQTIVLNIAFVVICVMGVYELLGPTKYIRNWSVMFFSLLFAGTQPLICLDLFKPFASVRIFLYVLILLFLFFKNYKTILWQEIATAFTVSFLVPYAFCCFIFLEDQFPQTGLFYIMFILSCAWVSDAGAYFIGRTFGKHKLAPQISPKKTIEGSIGGLVFCLIFNIAFTFVYVEVVKAFQQVQLQANLWLVIAFSLVASVLGMFGDLLASIIKRQSELKDFSNIMPGHGGVIDRFDSVLLLAPLFYIALQYVQIVTVQA